MEQTLTTLREKIAEKFARLGKGKYALLLAAFGIAILLLPVRPEETETTSDPVSVVLEQDTEQRMEQILSQVHGAGNVDIMLTMKNDGYTEYQTNKEQLTDGEREETRTETVFADADALIRYRALPEYLGAVVVCEGGSDPKVCLELVRAVCSLTGLTSDKITVLKMK